MSALLTVSCMCRSSEGMTKQDDEDLCVALHNPLFHQVVLVKSLGLVKVYQAEVGAPRLLYQTSIGYCLPVVYRPERSCASSEWSRWRLAPDTPRSCAWTGTRA